MGKIIWLINKALLWIEGPLWKFVKRWGMPIIVAIAIFLLYKVYRDNGNLKQELKDQETVYAFEKKGLDNSVKHWKDKYGNEHAVVEKLQASNLKQSKYIDSLAEVLELKSKNITGVTVVRTDSKLDDTLTKEIIYVDTCFDKDGNVVTYPTKQDFEYEDKWTKIWGTVSDKYDSIHYRTRDTMTIVDYWQRNKIFGLRIGKIKYYVDFANQNPHNTVTGAKKIELKKATPKWSIGPSVQVGYQILPLQKIDWKKPSVSIGITIQRNVIRF
jgi:hypothetical protein